MNRRRKAHLRICQRRQAKLAYLANNKPPKPNICKRCGRPIAAEWIYELGRWREFFEVCQCRNLHDGLGLPTPPELLDKFSLKPALSERDFKKQLRES